VTNFDDKNVHNGIYAAMTRAGNWGFKPPWDEKADADLVGDALSAWPYSLHPRFIELFAENVSTAAVARRINDEPLLTRSDVMAFLAVDSWFKNSWQHAQK
jgi:hypothetical protein